MYGICRLCRADRKLRKSHIIPNFVYKWLKETSGTGFIRFGYKPNLRAQDGFKFYWLCEECEQRFSSWETKFANTIFYPTNKGTDESSHYGPWLLKFAVLVSWRVLNFFVEEKDLSHFPPTLQKKVKTALSYWEKFLLGKSPHPDRFEQHLLPLGPIERIQNLDVPPNINRYILRTVDIDAVHGGDKVAYVYSKMSRFVLIGFIEMPHRREWQGSKLHVKNGVIEPTHYKVPETFGDYFFKKAKRLIEIQKSMSKNQKIKIDATYRRDLNRAADSGTLKAMDYDVDLFGEDAFTNEE